MDCFNKTTHEGMHDQDLRFGYRRRLGRLRPRLAARRRPPGAVLRMGVRVFDDRARTNKNRAIWNGRQRLRPAMTPPPTTPPTTCRPATRGRRRAFAALRPRSPGGPGTRYGGRSLQLAQNLLDRPLTTGRGGPGAIPSGPDLRPPAHCPGPGNRLHPRAEINRGHRP